MSSIPKAKKSNISGLVVVPDTWDAYPEVERSTLNTVRFENLTSDTRITHSNLNGVTIKEGGREYEFEDSRSTEVQRSELTACTVAGSCIYRSTLISSEATDAERIERSRAHNAKLINVHNVERSDFEGSVLAGESDVERSTVKDSALMGPCQIKRSQLDGVMMTKSQVSRSVLRDCEVVQCEIINTNFTGKTLKYGIWENGDLVGRTSEEHEVVIVQMLNGTRSLIESAWMVSRMSGSSLSPCSHMRIYYLTITDPWMLFQAFYTHKPGKRVSTLEPERSQDGPSNPTKETLAASGTGETDEADAPPPYDSHFI